jgi:hypothetical protein
MFRIENQDFFCSEVKFKRLRLVQFGPFFFPEKELSILLTNKMRSDVLKPIFPTKHRNLNAKSKESSGIEH